MRLLYYSKQEQIWINELKYLVECGDLSLSHNLTAHQSFFDALDHMLKCEVFTDSEREEILDWAE